MSTLRTVALFYLIGCHVNEGGLGTSQIHDSIDGGGAKDATSGATYVGRDGALDVGRIVTPDLPINAGGGGELGATGGTSRAGDPGNSSESGGAPGRDGEAPPDERIVSSGIPDAGNMVSPSQPAWDGAMTVDVPVRMDPMADAGGADAGGTFDTAGQMDTGSTTSCALGQFQAPERLTGLGPSGSNLYGPSLSADGRILYFATRYSSKGWGEDIYTATRTDGSVNFSSVTALDSVNTSYDDGTPSISADGLTLYFYSKRPGGSGGRDIWMATRATIQDSFGGEKPLAALNSRDDDHLPWVSADELTILFSSTRSGNPDLYISTRSSKSGEFSNPAVLGGANGTSSRADRAALSRDGLTIYFTSNRTGTLGDLDIWTATRSRSDVIFSGITNLKVVNTAAADLDVDLSADETELFFSSNRAGQYDLYRSVRKCK